MKFALYESFRIEPTSKFQGAVCPLCKEKVIAKCGLIKQWHWSHESILDCDSFGEPESEWHLNWKNRFPNECVEVIIEKHRADIKTKLNDSLGNSTEIIELQNSPISPQEILEREQVYKNMIWLFNGETFAKNLILRPNGSYISFRWKHPPKSLWSANKPIYIDLSSMIKSFDLELSKALDNLARIEKYAEENGVTFSSEKWILEERIKTLLQKIELYEDKLFLIKKIYSNIPCGGWGRIITKKEFLKRYSEKENDTTTI